MAGKNSKNKDSRYLNEEMLTQIGQLVNQRFDLERIHQLMEAFSQRAAGDPLAQLALALEELGLKLNPLHVPLPRVLWKATSEAPLIVWCEAENQFLLIIGANDFKVRLASLKDGASATTISRSRLARRLGLKSIHETVELGFIHSQTPAGRASAATETEEESQLGHLGKRTHKKSHKKSHHHEHEHAYHGMPPFRRFLRILRPELRDIFTLIIFALFSGVLYLALPLAVDRVVTNLAFGGQSDPYIQALLVVAQILAACLVLQALIIGFQYFTAEVIQRRIFVRATSELAFRLPRVNAQAYDGVHGPELVNRFLDIVTVQKNTAFFLLEGINVVTASLIGMVLLALYHPMLLVFVAILVVLIVATTWMLGRGALKTAIKESRTKYELVGWFEEIAAFPFMFKGAGGYELSYQHTNKLATDYVDARKKHFGNVFRQVAGLLVLSIIASVTLLILGTWLVLSQQITLGQLVASEIIMSGIVASLIKLGKKLEAWYDTLAATDKLGLIFDLETESTAGEEPKNTDYSIGMRLEVSDLGFGYPEGKPLFAGRNFDIPAGSRVAIYGPQGSGVSSLLDLLFAVRQPTQGFLIFDGLDSRSWQLEHLRESVQLLRKDEFIYGTITENLRLGRPEIGMNEIRDALQKVGLLDDILKHPDGLNLKLQVGGRPLSSSQRVCLLFARALVQKPRLLLIDELLDGIDEPTFKRLSSVVLDSNLPWTVMVATRSQEAIALCDWTIDLSPLPAQKQAGGNEAKPPKKS